MFSGGARTLSQSRCSCRPTPGARVLVVLYPAFRADALHAGLLADTRSAGSVSLCAAELISPTREAVARSAEAPDELNSAAPAADDKEQAQPAPHAFCRPFHGILSIPRAWGFTSRGGVRGGESPQARVACGKFSLIAIP